MPAKLPRPKGNSPLAIGPKLMARIMDLLERFGKFSVAAPLELIDHPGGWLLRLRPSQSSVVTLVKPTSAYAGQRGVYRGSVWTPPDDFDVTTLGDLDEADLGDAGADCIIVNTRETRGDAGSHIIDPTDATAAPTLFVGRLWTTDAGGLPVYAIDGIQDLIACPTT